MSCLCHPVGRSDSISLPLPASAIAFSLTQVSREVGDGAIAASTAGPCRTVVDDTPAVTRMVPPLLEVQVSG